MGNILDRCCKKRVKTPEELEKEKAKHDEARIMLNKLIGKEEVEDLIVKFKQPKQFADYCKTNFDMKNLMKYMENPDSNDGVFTLEFLQKMYHTALLWKAIIYDQAKNPLMAQRRECFKKKDNKGFKKCCAELEKMKETCF